MKLDKLIVDLEKCIDPTLNKTFKELNSIKEVSLDENNVVSIKIVLKNYKKNQSVMKLKIAKLVKVTHGFPGLKIEFDEYVSSDENKKNSPTFIGIASGKGGVGKSSVTANLALSFKRLGYKVGIIDADVYGASIPNIFKLPITPLSTDEEEHLIPADYDGIQVISPAFFMAKNQPLMWRGPMLGKLLIHFFEEVVWDDNTDLILIDLPPGTGDVAIDIAENIPKTKMIIVTTPHINAAKIALKAGVGAIEIGHELIGIIENMSYYLNRCNNQKEYIFGSGGGDYVSKELNVQLLAQIPINQPINENSFLFEKDEMNGKIYLKIAQELINILNIK